MKTLWTAVPKTTINEYGYSALCKVKVWSPGDRTTVQSPAGDVPGPEQSGECAFRAPVATVPD